MRALIPNRWDTLLAGVLAVGAVITLLYAPEPGELNSVGRLAVALCSTLPLAWRRSAPLAVLFAMVLAPLVLPAAVAPADATAPEFMALFVATYSVAAHGTLRDIGIGLACVAGGTALASWRFSDIESLQGTVVVALAHCLVAFAGRVLRKREVDVQRLETEQAEAIREERLRIARELHDLIAHSVSVMVVHAGAAQRQFDREPDRARQSLQTIEKVGREATAELQNLLGVLRSEGAPDNDGARELHLASLVEPVESTGIGVDLDVASIDGLPATASLCVHRVVQESLTNVVRHSSADRVQVAVQSDGKTVEVLVRDNGKGANGRPPGHGLQGMAERVRMLGGEFHAGSAEGGFEVRARIPWT